MTHSNRKGRWKDWYHMPAIPPRVKWRCGKSCKRSQHQSSVQDNSYLETLPDEGQNSYRSKQHQRSRVHDSMWMWKSVCRWDWKNVKTTYNWTQTSGQKCRQQQWTSSTCCWNRTYHPLGWSRGCVQRRTVDKEKDHRELDHQSTCQQPQPGHWSIHWPELEPTSVAPITLSPLHHFSPKLFITTSSFSSFNLHPTPN